MREQKKMIREMLGLIDQAYNKRAWHGTNLRGSLRGVKAEQAVWRPGPDRHNIWELMLHCAYWKYTVTRRITGDRRGSFAIPGSNWFVREDGTDTAAWRAELALLDRTHRALRRTIEELPPARWARATSGGKFSVAGMIAGIAAHDLYHAGQIQLVKALRAGREA